MAKGTINKVILVGRLGNDPDCQYSPGGLAVVKFSLATGDSFKAGDGTWEDKTEWHRIVSFGKTAEFCGNYLKKGRLIYLEGSLRTNQWQDEHGNKRASTEIIAHEIQTLGSGENRGAAVGGPYQVPAGNQTQPTDGAIPV